MKIGSRRLEQKALRRLSQGFFVCTAMFDVALSTLKTDLFAMLKNLGYFCTEEGRRLLDIFATMQYNVARLLRIT